MPLFLPRNQLHGTSGLVQVTQNHPTGGLHFLPFYKRRQKDSVVLLLAESGEVMVEW